jgi:FkbM family methyltransferase
VPRSVVARVSPGSTAARFLRPLAKRLLPAAPTEVNVRSGASRGARLLVNLQHEKYYWTGLHEVQVQQVLTDVLQRGATFWDVGAHAGFFTLLGSRAVGPTGHVWAFEPAPASFERLKWAVRANGLGNTDIRSLAVSSTDGEAILFEGRSTLMATLDPTRRAGRSLEVPCRTVDTLADELGVPDVIKVDVEGLELELLQGGRRTFAARRTRVVVELASPEREHAALDLMRGYTALQVSESNWLFEPTPS